MDSYGGDQKAAVMQQVRQEAAMTNARQLIEVCCNVTPLSVLLPMALNPRVSNE
jgi:hypothetical protein